MSVRCRPVFGSSGKWRYLVLITARAPPHHHHEEKDQMNEKFSISKDQNRGIRRVQVEIINEALQGFMQEK